MKHRIKILPCYFAAVLDGSKTFEIRDNSDRGFQKGDEVALVEVAPNVVNKLKPTGEEVSVLISYVTGYAQKPDYVVFGFTVID